MAPPSLVSVNSVGTPLCFTKHKSTPLSPELETAVSHILASSSSSSGESVESNDSFHTALEALPPSGVASPVQPISDTASLVQPVSDTASLEHPDLDVALSKSGTSGISISNGAPKPENIVPPVTPETTKMPTLIQIPRITTLVEEIPKDFFPEEVTNNFFITKAGIALHRILPGIPIQYEREYLENRALYVMIGNPKWTIQFVEAFFEIYGNVDKSVTIFDTKSGDTFRWVIMKTAEEAEYTADTLNLETICGIRVPVMMAHAPYCWYDVGIDFKWMDFFNKKQDASMVRIRARYLAAQAHQSPDPLGNYGPIGSVANKPEEDTPEAKSSGMSSTQPQLSQAGTPLKSVGVLAAVPEIVPVAQVAAIVARAAAAPAVTPAAAKVIAHIAEHYAPIPRVAAPVPQVVAPVPQIVAPVPRIVVPAPAPSDSTITWANVASTATTPSKIINLNPENKTNSAAPRPPIYDPAAIALAMKMDDLRVIIIFNLPSTVTLEEVSNAVKEGPLASINFGIDANTGNRFVGIIFQKAYNADAFYRVLMEEKRTSRPTRFRFIVDADKTTHPTDDIIRAMASPIYATRRLTIVKSGFFFSNNERNIRTVIEKAVKPERIELIHLYNGGNATIVLADVESAIVIKKMLDHMSHNAGTDGIPRSYWGLQTNFSKDPCSMPEGLRLVTDMK